MPPAAAGSAACAISAAPISTAPRVRLNVTAGPLSLCGTSVPASARNDERTWLHFLFSWFFLMQWCDRGDTSKGTDSASLVLRFSHLRMRELFWRGFPTFVLPGAMLEAALMPVPHGILAFMAEWMILLYAWRSGVDQRISWSARGCQWVMAVTSNRGAWTVAA